MRPRRRALDPLPRGLVRPGVAVVVGVFEPRRRFLVRDDGGARILREGDEQFEISDTRSIRSMYGDMEREGLQPVLNDYLYV